MHSVTCTIPRRSGLPLTSAWVVGHHHVGRGSVRVHLRSKLWVWHPRRWLAWNDWWRHSPADSDASLGPARLPRATGGAIGYRLP